MVVLSLHLFLVLLHLIVLLDSTEHSFHWAKLCTLSLLTTSPGQIQHIKVDCLDQNCGVNYKNYFEGCKIAKAALLPSDN